MNKAEIDQDYVAVPKDVAEITDDDINAFEELYNRRVAAKGTALKPTRECFAAAWSTLLNRIGIAITRDEIILD